MMEDSMFAMRLFGLLAYTAIGAGVGAFIWLDRLWTAAGTVPILLGAIVGFLVGIVAWINAERS